MGFISFEFSRRYFDRKQTNISSFSGRLINYYILKFQYDFFGIGFFQKRNFLAEHSNHSGLKSKGRLSYNHTPLIALAQSLIRGSQKNIDLVNRGIWNDA